MGMCNFFKGELIKGNVAGLTDVWKIILMATGFTFDIDAHDGYSNVSASELSTANGYTAGGQTLTNVAVTVDDANDRADMTWDAASWTASGGSIGPSPAAVIYNDTHASDVCAGDIPFGSDQTATDGGTFVVNNPTVRIA